ncbi:helix-turn-helix domain-containing protein [Kitasatospora sp. MBT66]|uniref:helix-turn-helix domain-containing protein n=1 Tax=Kitasatospora sp. MBT66 TaxID=1444769 RepID=UPI00068AC94D|nr:helix-turn-helix transcriptional regulator [Kitasatospora sp. MBT66]
MLEQPDFGRRLRQLRRERGMTVRQLAGAGYSQAHMSRIETGNRNPTPKTLAWVSRQLKIDPAELDYLPEDPESPLDLIEVATQLGVPPHWRRPFVAAVLALAQGCQAEHHQEQPCGPTPRRTAKP